MAYTSIDDPSAYFQVALYTGTGSTQSITNDGNSDLKPDMVWVKKRNGAESHALSDSTRGTSATLFPDLANGESTSGQGINSFNTDGFQVGTEGIVSDSGNTFVAWQWKANGGTTSSNTDGSITSTVQANTTAGFSIVTYSSDNTSSETIGHGLGAVPKMIIVKRRNSNNRDWAVYHEGVGNTKYLQLNESDAEIDNAAYWNDTSPTSSVFSIGTGNNSRVNSASQVAYCFVEKQGYSKFGKYVGNGSTNGVFVYTGFKPSFVMIKIASGTTEEWSILDTKRNDSGNPLLLELFANSSSAEYNGSRAVDFLSNGFKPRLGGAIHNGSGNRYIYMAFAENPFTTSTGIPTTAR